MSYNTLIVDDSPIIRKMIRRALGLSGLQLGEIREAGDGREALQVLDGHWVDIVLTDIHMPEMNGIELVERMAGDPLLARIPVLVVSTERGEERILHLQRLGIQGYLTKPFTPEQIRDAVTRALVGA